MSRHPALSQWTQQVSIHLPHLSRPQASALAMWSFGMVMVRACGISTVSALLASLLHKKEDAVRQQLRELCYDPEHKRGTHRLSLDVTACFAPLLEWVLSWWSVGPDGCTTERRMALAMDATTLGQRFVVLSISVVYRGCAIPVGWKVTKATSKGAWRPYWLELFEQLAPSVPPDWVVIVLADRGLYAKWLYRQVVRMGWHPYLRINRGAKCRPVGQREFIWLDDLVPRVGTRWCGEVSCFCNVEGRLDCTLLGCWEEGHKEAWLVLTDLPPQVAEAGWYGMRSWIEAGFKQLKRGGWGWHQTKMTDPGRASRLWLAMAIATLWAVSVGGEVEEGMTASSLEELPELGVGELHPARRGRQGRRGASGIAKARMLSCFRRGVIAIVAAMLSGQPLPLGHFLPQPWPTRLTTLKTYP